MNEWISGRTNGRRNEQTNE